MGRTRKSQHHPPYEQFGRQHDERGRCELAWRRAQKKHVELEINYTATKREHTLPLMCKWFCEFHKGNNKSDVSYIDVSGSQKSMDSAAQTVIADTASGSSGWVVNIWHEKLADIRARSLVQESGKESLENQLNGGRDVLSSMAAKAPTDSSLLLKRQDRLTVDRETNAVVRLPMSASLVFYVLCVWCCALCAVRCVRCVLCRVSCVVRCVLWVLC